jgi:hypothetical protein
MKKILLVCLGLVFSSSALAAGGIRWQNTESLLIGGEGAEIAPAEKQKSVVLVWGSLDVYGEVEDLKVISGTAVFHPGSKLTNSLVILGGSFESKGGQLIPPDKVEYRDLGFWWRMALKTVGLADHALSRYFFWIASAVFLLGAWGFGLLLFFFVPSLVGLLTGKLLQEGGKNFAAGILGTFLVPVLVGLFIFSLVGILLLPILFFAFFCLAVTSYLAAALWAGHRLIPPAKGQVLQPWGFLLGLTAFQLLWLSGVAWAWLPVWFLWFLCWGRLLRTVSLLWR